ncbi:MAG: membrane-bound lytic murein transglycosylase MltF, partial [Woeseiaceae bacterium]
PLLAQRKWYSRVPTGYARGWEPVLYVNNIRAYYNILKWLTANETVPDELDENLGEELLEDGLDEQLDLFDPPQSDEPEEPV